MVYELLEDLLKVFNESLNPCSNGRWSMSALTVQEMPAHDVLILVLMADGL